MVELAGLTELTSSVLEIILADGFVWTERKEGFGRVGRLQASARHNVCRVIILAGSSVLAFPRSQIVPAVFWSDFWLLGV
jgi:hypothetical protein